MFLLSFIMMFNQWKSCDHLPVIMNQNSRCGEKVWNKSCWKWFQLLFCFIWWIYFCLVCKKTETGTKTASWVSKLDLDRLVPKFNSEGGLGHIYYIKNQETRYSWLFVYSGTLTQVPWFWNLDSGTLILEPWLRYLDSTILT